MFLSSTYIRRQMSDCKERWRGKTLEEVFVVEFGFSEVYIEKAIQKCTLKILRKPRKKEIKEDSPSNIIRNGDCLSHTWCYHEKLVPFHIPFTIILRSDEILIADKPGGWATIPGGPYKRNSAVNHLKWKFNLDYIHPLNRLDRQTSGLICFLLTSSISAKFSRVLQNEREKVVKIYFALTTSTSLESSSKTEDVALPLCLCRNEGPLKTLVSSKGAKSRTLIQHISSKQEGKDHFSLYLCRPVTGRTHQLRCHLAATGRPIYGDLLYGGKAVRDDKKIEFWGKTPEFSGVDFLCTDEEGIEEAEKVKAKELCEACTTKKVPKFENDNICLHSYLYEINGIRYATEIPSWVISMIPAERCLSAVDQFILTSTNLIACQEAQ